MANGSFPDEVAEQLKWYVYRLIDPRNGETFYVGKGKGNRIFDHAKGILPTEEGEAMDPKLQRIKEILTAGLEVGHVIHRHGLSTTQIAYLVEAAVIDAFPGLTNRIRGHGSTDYGSRHVVEIIREYAGEEFQVKKPLMLISIGVFYYRRDNPYDAVRYAWKVNPDRVKQFNLVLARLRGLVVGAYRCKEWLPATRVNFPDLAERYSDVTDIPNFYGFVGKPAEADAWEYYVGKRVPRRFLRSQNAIRYLKPES